MNKLLTALLACATGLALGGNAFAADQGGDPQARDNQTQTQPNATKGKPEQSDSQAISDRTKEEAAAGNEQDRSEIGANDPPDNQASDQANRAGTGASDDNNTKGSASDPAYSADLKKCDSMQGENKQKCITTAKKKAGQM
jgi:hypothetical protein